VQTPLTAFLAFLFLGEPVNTAQVAGGVLVLVGVWIVNRYSRRQTILAD
jgi:drug/metabolite transporter (DMT)-like permease